MYIGSTDKKGLLHAVRKLRVTVPRIMHSVKKVRYERGSGVICARIAASGSARTETRRAGASPMTSPSAAVAATPRLPRPNDIPSIIPDAMPAFSGSACCAQMIELGCGAISIKPAAKRTAPPSTSALTWVK